MAKKAVASKPFEYTSAQRNNWSVATFNNDSGMSVRAPYSRDVYESYRSNEIIPLGRNQQELRQIMIMCKSAYERVGVIKSVIDMMSEFGADGIEIIHPDDGPNEFYKAWQRRIGLCNRAERFLSWFFKSGQTVVRRKMGTIQRQDLKSLKESKIIEDALTGRIPIDYIFYDPATIELVGDYFGTFADKRVYALRVPLNMFGGITRPRNDLEKQVYNSLPKEIKDALEGKGVEGTIYYLPIPEDKIHVAYYKKDDSDLWAKSFIYSILSDVIYNDKLRLAKTSALDNWYNAIRLWKLGDHKNNVPATPESGARLVSIIEANTGGGAADIIWDSAISLEEFYPPLEKIVNFQENIHNILLGLGVPEGLVGGVSDSANATNNFIGLKNLSKRLEAGRRALDEWLNKEIDIIQTEMGFRKRPVIRYSNNDLFDEKAYFSLLVQLVDRGVISDQTILERIKESPEIELSRVAKEESLREQEIKPAKASPYHKPDLVPQQEHEIDKIKLQGKITSDNRSNSPAGEVKEPRANGRPYGARDSSKRRRGINKVKTSRAKLLKEANRIFDLVDTFVKKNVTEDFAVAGVRQLNSEQYTYMDTVRTELFGSLEPFTIHTEEDILMALSNMNKDVVLNFKEIFEELIGELGTETIDINDKKTILAQAYLETWLDDGV